MRSPLAVLLALSLAWPSAPAAADDCFKPVRMLEDARDRRDRALNRYALLRWKADLGLFDLRMCNPSWGCPYQDEMQRERDEIIAAAQVEGVSGAVVSVGKAVDLAVADSLLTVLASPFKDDKELKEKTDKLKEKLDQRIEDLKDQLPDLKVDTDQARSQLLHATANYNSKLAQIDQLRKIQSRRKKARVEWRIQHLMKSKDKARAALDAVQGDYHRGLFAQAEIARSVEATERAKNLLEQVGTVTTLVQTASAIGERDLMGTAKGFREILSSINDWSIERLGGDVTDADKALREARHKYTVKSRKRKGMLDKDSESQLIGAIVSAQQAGVDAEDAKKLLEGFKKGLDFIGSTLDAIEKVKAGYAQAAELVGKIQKTRESMVGLAPQRAIDAISYFQLVSAAVREVARIPQMKVIAAILDGAADNLEFAAEIPQAFARLRAKPLGGGRLTAGFEYQGQDDLFRNHPLLMGLKAFVPPEKDTFRLIPSPHGGSEVELSRPEFDRVIFALSTLTGLTGKNPDQETLHSLASGVAQPFLLPSFGRTGLSRDDRSATVDALVNTSERVFLEEEMGSGLREIEFLNRSLDFGGERFAVEDFKDLKKYVRMLDLSKHQLTLDEAFRIAYGAELTPRVFGSVLASSGSGPRTPESVSGIEKRILQARNRRINAAAGAPPVRIAWVRARQVSDERVEALVSLETGKLEESELVCRKVVARYPDGSTALTTMTPAGPREDPMSATFALAGIDWAKAGSPPSLSFEVTALAGKSVVNAKSFLPLDFPARADELLVVPAQSYTSQEEYGPGGNALPADDEAFQSMGGAAIYVGQAVKLLLSATLSDRLRASIDPEVTFRIEAEGGPASAVRAARASEKNGVGLLAEATWQVPEGTPPGTRFAVEGVVSAGTAESKVRTSFVAEALPAADVAEFAPSVGVTVRAQVPKTEPRDYPLYSGARVTFSSGQTGITDAWGGISFGPLDPGSFTAAVEPREGDKYHTAASGSTTIADFDPDITPSDPNDYSIEVVLPYQEPPKDKPEDGHQGPSGPGGASGGAGSGPAGPSGPAGGTGASGPGGPSGASGASGGSGPSGPSGGSSAGASGPSGVAGPGGPDARTVEDCKALLAAANQAISSGDLRAARAALESLRQRCAAMGPTFSGAVDGIAGQIEQGTQGIVDQVVASVKDCEYERAVEEAEALERLDPAHRFVVENLPSLRTRAAAQKAARVHLKAGKAAIEAKKLGEAIAALRQGLAVAGVPDCMAAKMRALLGELERHQRFLELTAKVAEANNDRCNFKEAEQYANEIAGIAPRETFMADWLNENQPKIADLKRRESEAMAFLAQARTAAATAQKPDEWGAVVALLQQAWDAAPQCVRTREGIDALLKDAERKKNPPGPETSMVLLIDTSGSMAENDKIGQARRAAAAAVRKASQATEMAILSFDGGCDAGAVKIVHDFSTDANSLGGVIGSLNPGGGTPMYIAVGFAVEHVKKRKAKTRTVVLMSDGGDSCRDKMAQASAGISNSHIPVNTIGFDVGANQQAQDDLRNLSTLSGGRNVSASAKDPREIIRAFDIAMLPNLLKDADLSGGGQAPAVAAYFKEARARVSAQDLDGATFQLQQAYKVAPDSPAVNYNLSLLYESQDQLINSMKHASNYLGLAPGAFDRADVESRIVALQEELKRNPRVQIDSGACQDVYRWAQAEQDVAKRARDAARRQAILEIMIAGQRGDCDKARAARDLYTQRYR